MESRKGFFESRSHDLVNLVASLIGILGFLTGISNLPSIISGNGKEIISWFGSQISFWLSIPVFLFTLFFVYGLYFLIMVQVYKWLYGLKALWWHFSWFELFEFIYKGGSMLKEIEANLVSTFFFSMIGLALGGFIFQAFFGLGFWSELQNNLISFLAVLITAVIFLSGLCGLAQHTASRIVNSK